MKVEEVSSKVYSLIDMALSSKNEEDIVNCAGDISLGENNLKEIVEAVKLLVKKHDQKEIILFVESFKLQENRNII